MNAAQAFANRRDALLAQLPGAKSLDQAISLCQFALEQVACELAQNEPDEHARQRQLAVLAAARRAPQLLYSACARGELVPAAQESAPLTRSEQICRYMKLVGGFLLGALAVAELVDGKTLFALLQLVGANLLLFGSAKKAEPMQARGVPYADAQQLVRALEELCQAVDICVSDLMLLEKDMGFARLSGTADDAMLDLMTALMEAKASGRDDLAMRSLTQAEQYLHLLGIELIGYDEQHAQLFDLLPTLGASRTIRPAMMKNGKILRRGVAATAMERSVGA